ncbi:hypothetical protein RI129_011469 [Pyrocoelia pectoralis]|uniref:S1-like domain-containing protein n=1 Tax=Pyrocoelia pectoralis TaxID=417401 RepID=A0AAN7ZIS8_9COLE
MPKNKGKGGKNRRRGKNENETEKRELVFKEDGQEYAQVTKMLGNGRLEAMCFDGIKRLLWINQGDIILIGLRDYQDAKADVILKYTPDEARNLKTYGEFPETVRINDTVTFVEDGLDEDIEFGDDISSGDEADPVDGVRINLYFCLRLNSTLLFLDLIGIYTGLDFRGFQLKCVQKCGIKV